MTDAPTIAEARAALAEVREDIEYYCLPRDTFLSLDRLAAFIDAQEAREAELTDDIQELRVTLREVRARTETFSEPGR